MHLPEPTFPPLLTGHPVKSPVMPFAHAVEAARAGRLGAGDVVWSRNTSRLDCAIVLEPDVPPERTLEIHYLTMVAFGDALGATAPPEVAVTYGWPATLRVNGGIAGGFRTAMADTCGETGAPDWLVVSVGLAMRGDFSILDPGRDRDHTNLDEEGCSEVDRTTLLDSFCRHFLTWIHTWEEDGFKPVHENWLFRADGYREEIALTYDGRALKGTFIGLDDHGNLLLKTDAGMEVLLTERALGALLQQAET